VKQVQRIYIMGFLFFLFLGVPLIPTALVKLPGHIDHYIHYLSSYSLTEENVLFHLNEVLLFEEMPTYQDIQWRYMKGVFSQKKMRLLMPRIRSTHKRALKMTLTHKLMNIFPAHREVKEFLFNTTGDYSGMIAVDLRTPGGYRTAAALLDKIGLTVTRDSGSRYRLIENMSPMDFDLYEYYKIVGFNTWTLERQLNRGHRLDFKISEFAARLPRDVDFFRDVTGLPITADSFAEILTREKRLRIFLGLLYRLSDREIRYIDGLAGGNDAWKAIYKDNAFLAGMFILSHALRVNGDDTGLRFPGGPDALPFWERLAGIGFRKDPLKFLERLAVKDNGLLNYYFVFTFFLPEERQKMFLFDFNFQEFRDIYQLLDLPGNQRLKDLEIPKLEDFSYFTLMYALDTRSEVWAKAVGAEKNNFYGLLHHVMSRSKKENSLKRFISIHTKFYHRSELLTEDVLRTLYDHYDEYNVLVDFIEKIPLRDAGTVLKLFRWVKALDGTSTDGEEKETITALFQCLLELLANRAKYAADEDSFRDRWDPLVEAVMQIPLSGTSTYDGFFQYFQDHLHIDPDPARVDQSFFNFLLPGLTGKKPQVTIRNQTYFLESSSFLNDQISTILVSQGACSLSQLVKINGLLESLRAPKNTQNSQNRDRYRMIARQLIDALEALPFPEEGKEMPGYLRKFVQTYSRKGILKRLERLASTQTDSPGEPEIDSLIQKIKTTCLLQELKHYLVTCVYALNIKHARLQVFLNPNLTRFHDFSSHREKTPWNHSEISQQLGEFTVYHLTGGLSRLNITLSFPFSEYLLMMPPDSNPTQRVPMLYNNLDLYPYSYSPGSHVQEYVALLVKFGDELLQKAGEDPSLRRELMDELATLTAGYHYRTVTERLNSKSKEIDLYFSDILRLGERYVKKNKYIETFSLKDRLKVFQEPGVYREVREGLEHLGCIYYHTFGTLRPHRFTLFPQPLSHLFQSTWVGGEMIDEFKIKAAYISHGHEMSPRLLGHFIYRYLIEGAYMVRQSYKNDYHKTYFLYSTYNYLYLYRIYNQLRENGILRIK
jgi:hypothetical protein